MKTKFIVKLDNLDSGERFLAKNHDNGYKIVPFGFKFAKFKHEIAYFDTNLEAIEAYEEALKHEGHQGLPIIMEVIIK